MSQPQSTPNEVSTTGGDATKKTNLTLVKGNGQPGQEPTLLMTIAEMAGSLGIMNDIIQKANFIAVSASIEAARTQTQSENFSLVADQVRRQAEKTQELASDLEREINQLELSAMRATAVRYADIASDLIDKVDRNLFERNCDCQAWAGFDEIRNVAKLTKGLNGPKLIDLAVSGQAINPTLKAIAAASVVLEKLCNTYQVYIDVIVINNQGVIVSSARDKSLVGMDKTQQPLFKEVMTKGAGHVSDLHKSALVNQYTVSYSAPIKNDDGSVVGILSTRFNWNYVQEMLESMPVEPETKLFLINNEGTLIAKKPLSGLLTDSLSWLMAGEAALAGGTGYTIECARNGQLSAWGFCQTYGFAAYPGKGWSAIVSFPIHSKNREFFVQTIKRDGDSKRQAAEQANQLLEKVTGNISQVVNRINSINNETNMLAVNAAIQAGVAGAEGESFSVIASEIGKLSKQSEDFVKSINALTETLGKSVSQTIFKRLGEAAFDTIDKVDRNLFERFCDIQAFASFSAIKHCLEGQVKVGDIQILLRSLQELYEVYHDIFLLDHEGKIISAAKHRDLEGTVQRDRDWFREALAGKTVVSDFYKSKSIEDYTVTFAAPILGDAGKSLGVITTRFNCKFIFDIMRATIVGKDSIVYLVNQKGLVIGSTNQANLLQDSLSSLSAFQAIDSRSHGYEIEHKDGAPFAAAGFAKTKGYLTYHGKGWSILILRPFLTG